MYSSAVDVIGDADVLTCVLEVSKTSCLEEPGTTENDSHGSSPAIYFGTHSLGLQPRVTKQYIDAQLKTWASIGPTGHVRTLENSPIVAWQDMADLCAERISSLVGALPGEIVFMNTLTANLHLMMASFYKPTNTRHKIIVEWRPFPATM